MHESSKKEEFSYGYIHMLASMCGYIITPSKRMEDNYLKIDLHIKDSKSLDDGGTPTIFVQAKFTTPKYFCENEECFKFRLKEKDYNQLIKKSIDLHILIVVVAPENIEEWINIYEDKQETLIKANAYWLLLEGMRRTEKTQPVIEIPKENILTPKSLREIMKSATERRTKLFEILENENKAE
jgi:ribonuclease HIII